MASETLRGLTTPYRAESIDAFLEGFSAAAFAPDF
jgi:hypothetical protein